MRKFREWISRRIVRDKYFQERNKKVLWNWYDEDTSETGLQGLSHAMKAVIQRVKNAQVTVAGQVVGQIGRGLLVLLGVAKDDNPDDADYLARKVSELRVFEDPQGKMNLGAEEVGAEFLVVSQFTLLGRCIKGRRPSFDDAADPQKGEELYQSFVNDLRQRGFKVETGVFRAMMDVALVNDGPVTLILDSHHGAPGRQSA